MDFLLIRPMFYHLLLLGTRWPQLLSREPVGVESVDPIIIKLINPCHLCVRLFILIHHPLHFQNGHPFEDFEERFAAATPVRMRGPCLVNCFRSLAHVHFMLISHALWLQNRNLPMDFDEILEATKVRPPGSW